MAVVITHHYISHVNPITPHQFSHFIIFFSSPTLSQTHTTMASLQSLACSSPVSHRVLNHPLLSPGAKSWSMIRSAAQSSFCGQTLTLQHSHRTLQTKSSCNRKLTVMMVKPTIQFIQGTDEQTVPDVKLTKSKDGTNGMAIFKFDQPSVFDSSSVVGDITGFYMIDDEGIIQSVDVNAKFVNGKPAGIEAKYIMRTPREWDRFMRFMERYANQNGLEFIKK